MRHLTPLRSSPSGRNAAGKGNTEFTLCLQGAPISPRMLAIARNHLLGLRLFLDLAMRWPMVVTRTFPHIPITDLFAPTCSPVTMA